MERSLSLCKVIYFLLAVLLCTLPFGSAHAKPAALTCISPGGLQTAINAAAEGVSLPLCAGTFYETLTISKTLTLVGASRDTTILQPAGSTDRVITVNPGKNLTLQNLQVTGAHPTGVTGGGIYLPSGNLTLVSVWIHHNSANYGGGVFQAGAAQTLTATDSLFDHNTATNHGGALYVEGNLTLTNTTFSTNTAGWHGGGAHVQNGNATLIGGSFTENHATSGNGGGLNINNDLNINGTTFTSNTAGDSGGALVQWNSTKTVVINNAAFTSNTAKVKGGGAYVGSYFTLTNSTFSSNLVDSGDTRNTAGGGVYANDGVNASQATFIQNTATCPPWNGGTGCTSSQGGGMAVNRLVAGGNALVTQSLFDGNRSWDGSGIFSHTGVQLFVSTSRFINNGQNCVIYSVIMCGYGGGIEAAWLDGNNLTIDNNVVSNQGGALDVSFLSLVNSRLASNSAGVGGGAIRTQAMSGVNLLFSQNTSSTGAAIRFTNSTISSNLMHVTIANASRLTGTAINIDTGAVVTIKNSIISSYAIGVNVDGTLTEDYNLYYDNGVHLTATGTLNPGGHSGLVTDAGFFNRSANNYHLRWGSPAIGKGTNLGVNLDIEGKVRINRWDIGAYQFWSSLFLPMLRK